MKNFNTAQKITIVIFTVLLIVLVVNQYLNNFNFTL